MTTTKDNVSSPSEFRSGVITMMGFSSSIALPTKVMDLLVSSSVLSSYDVEIYNNYSNNNNNNSNNNGSNDGNDIAIIEQALLHPPYRRFMQGNHSDTVTAATPPPPTTTTTKIMNRPSILIFQLPHENSSNSCNSRVMMDMSFVRNVIYEQLDHSSDLQSVIVLLYNPNTNTFIVPSSADVSESTTGSSDHRDNREAIDDLLQLMLTSETSILIREQFYQCALSTFVQYDRSIITSMIASTNNNNKKKNIVIVVGSGGREHAIAVQLAKSNLVSRIVCYPGNGGTAITNTNTTTDQKISNYMPTPEEMTLVYGNSKGGGNVNDMILYLCDTLHPSMVVIGPEQPLVDGLTDTIHTKYAKTIHVFGPTQAAAQLEASKAYSKDFMKEYNIPTASYRNFTIVQDAIDYIISLDIDHQPQNRQVIKASGLAAGKGVLLPTTQQETIDAIHEIMSNKAFGTAGDTCVIESYLDGPEASCLAFCDGHTAICMPAAQDHKRALDNDCGYNTGGMGAYAPAPCITPNLYTEIESLCQRTVEKMKTERGIPYVGILYAGVILTKYGPYILEYNCRFGDPETQVLLPLLKTDLYEIMVSCCTGTLDRSKVQFHTTQHTATVVCASLGYPQSYPKNMLITGLDVVSSTIPNVKVYHAGTYVDTTDSTSTIFRCNGGRVLAVTGIGTNLSMALESAYKAVRSIDFINESDNSNESFMHYRTDIGRRALERKLRIGVLGSTRGTALLPVIEACNNGALYAEIVAVISNKETALILEKGRALGPSVVTKSISSKGLSRDQYDAECTATLLDAGVDYVILVGYMRILSKSFTDYWHGKCINVHPSLLPKHAGGMDLAVHQAVLDAKETETGCTIHYVTEQVDGGPIVVQKVVSVDLLSDTAETLKAKVQPLEGPAFVQAIQLYCQQNRVGPTRAETTMPKNVISYADAGVSIDAGNQLVDMIKPYCKSTRRPGCDADLGGFGGLFDLAAAGYDSSETVLIGATDGVGTKLQIAQITGKHATIGIDLVAMCVNDLVVAGGEPLFFLDYFATGHLKVEEAAMVVKGIAEGCTISGCGLIGGETAEMPSMYAPGEYDLAGFTVGAVRRDKILPQNICVGDVLLGIASSGIHSNGYSLVRKLVAKANLSYDDPCPWDSNYATVGDALLVPTKIYVKPCLPLIQQSLVKGMAHITGGGLLENLPRSLPDDCQADIRFHPSLPPVFKWLKDTSGLDDTEMLRTFNCGIGMVLILSVENVQRAKDILAEWGETEVYELGTVSKGDKKVVMNVCLNSSVQQQFIIV